MKKIIDLDYPFNFVIELFGYRPETELVSSIAKGEWDSRKEELEKIVNLTFQNCLNDEEIRLLNQRFFYKNSFDNIAKNYGVSGAAINSRKNKLMRRLRLPKNSFRFKEFLDPGFVYVPPMTKKEIEEEKDAKYCWCINYKTNLTTRSYNAIRRAGYAHGSSDYMIDVRELIGELTPKELLNLKNFGPFSLTSVISAMEVVDERTNHKEPSVREWILKAKEVGNINEEL